MQTFHRNFYLCLSANPGRAAVSSLIVKFERNPKMITLFFLSIHASSGSELHHSIVTSSFSQNSNFNNVNYGSTFISFLFFLVVDQTTTDHFSFYYRLLSGFITRSVDFLLQFFYKISTCKSTVLSPYLVFNPRGIYTSAQPKIFYGKN